MRSNVRTYGQNVSMMKSVDGLEIISAFAVRQRASRCSAGRRRIASTASIIPAVAWNKETTWNSASFFHVSSY